MYIQDYNNKKKRKLIQYELPLLPIVRLKGLEPPRLTTLDPKSSAATNYATAAWYTVASQNRTFSNAQIYIILEYELIHPTKLSALLMHSLLHYISQVDCYH